MQWLKLRIYLNGFNTAEDKIIEMESKPIKILATLKNREKNKKCKKEHKYMWNNNNRKCLTYR